MFTILYAESLPLFMGLILNAVPQPFHLLKGSIFNRTTNSCMKPRLANKMDDCPSNTFLLKNK
jgi:hypothetical protein